MPIDSGDPQQSPRIAARDQQQSPRCAGRSAAALFPVLQSAHGDPKRSANRCWEPMSRFPGIFNFLTAPWCRPSQAHTPRARGLGAARRSACARRASAHPGEAKSRQLDQRRQRRWVAGGDSTRHQEHRARPDWLNEHVADFHIAQRCGQLG